MPKGVVVSFKKDQGFGSLTLAENPGAPLPFDYEVCGNFGDHPREGDAVDVEVGISRLGKPKATKVLFVSRGAGGSSAAGPDPKEAMARQIAQDLAEYTRRGIFATVDARWIVDAGLGQADRLYAVARFALRGTPEVIAQGTDPVGIARQIAGLFGDKRGLGEPLELTDGRLRMRHVGSGQIVALPIASPFDVAKLFNFLLKRIDGAPDRVFPLSEPAAGLRFCRAPLATLQTFDPERLLPIRWAAVEPSAKGQ